MSAVFNPCSTFWALSLHRSTIMSGWKPKRNVSNRFAANALQYIDVLAKNAADSGKSSMLNESTHCINMNRPARGNYCFSSFAFWKWLRTNYCTFWDEHFGMLQVRKFLQTPWILVIPIQMQPTPPRAMSSTFSMLGLWPWCVSLLSSSRCWGHSSHGGSWSGHTGRHPLRRAHDPRCAVTVVILC